MDCARFSQETQGVVKPKTTDSHTKTNGISTTHQHRNIRDTRQAIENNERFQFIQLNKHYHYASIDVKGGINDEIKVLPD